LRLFDKRIANWGGTNPHDKIELKENVPIKHLNGDILHYSYNSIEEHVMQSNNFTTIAAASLHAKGQKSNWIKILVNPFWSFCTATFSGLDSSMVFMVL
jgi:hypothetical protein